MKAAFPTGTGVRFVQLKRKIRASSQRMVNSSHASCDMYPLHASIDPILTVDPLFRCAPSLFPAFIIPSFLLTDVRYTTLGLWNRNLLNVKWKYNMTAAQVANITGPATSKNSFVYDPIKYAKMLVDKKTKEHRKVADKAYDTLMNEFAPREDVQ